MLFTLLFFGVAFLGLFTLYSLGNSRSDQDPLSDFMNDKSKKFK
jgi:hypothetical protein